MVHDAGTSKGRLERMRIRFPDAHAVVFGHSHIPLHEQRDGFQIFNPGSPTDRRRQPRHSMGMARVNGNGRTFGWRSSILASSENFRARSGFFPRPGLVHLNFDPRVAAYGESGALMESITFDVNLNGRWRYRDFVSGGEIMDKQLHFNLNSTLRGGWELTGSLLLSLTLSPALAALLLKPKGDHRVETGVMGVLHRAGDRFNQAFDRVSAWYGRVTRKLITNPRKVLLTYGALIAAAVALFWATPAGFIPAQDQNYSLAVVQLPAGSSLERTDAVLKKVAARLVKIEGVEAAVMFTGYDGASGTQASNTGASYLAFKDYGWRAKRGRAFRFPRPPCR